MTHPEPYDTMPSHRHRRTRPSTVVLLVGLWVALLLTGSAFGGARIGSVRVVNEMEKGVVVYSRVTGYFGAERWERVVTLAGRSYVDLPNVPAGALLGAATEDGQAYWEPITVDYQSGEIYTLRLDSGRLQTGSASPYREDSTRQAK